VSLYWAPSHESEMEPCGWHCCSIVVTEESDSLVPAVSPLPPLTPYAPPPPPLPVLGVFAATPGVFDFFSYSTRPYLKVN